MPRNHVAGQGPIIREDVHNISVCQLMAWRDILAVHLGADHVVAHVCVHMIGKVQNRCSLESKRHGLRVDY